MRTLIVSKNNMWVLTIKKDSQLIRTWTFKKLIEALNMASTLQLHVTNIDSLPLGQYAHKG